jgi:hypothetical protein
LQVVVVADQTLTLVLLVRLVVQAAVVLVQIQALQHRELSTRVLVAVDVNLVLRPLVLVVLVLSLFAT